MEEREPLDPVDDEDEEEEEDDKPAIVDDTGLVGQQELISEAEERPA